jgi:8-oxo-dGTP pyrophosphatase MutT (NUDIX family)
LTSPLALARIRQVVAAHRPTVLPADRPHAAVTLLLIDASPVPEALFIVRARFDRDPWSGDIGFPGGRVAPDDADPRRTAERETREELALDLTATDYLGRLDDLYGATLPILVSCFVYAAARRPHLVPNHEVEATFWIPLERLCDPARHRLDSFDYRGRPTTQPVADLLGPGAPLLWGITYRVLRNFFSMLDVAFGLAPPETSCPPVNSR